MSAITTHLLNKGASSLYLVLITYAAGDAHLASMQHLGSLLFPYDNYTSHLVRCSMNTIGSIKKSICTMGDRKEGSRAMAPNLCKSKSEAM